jgi:putative transposase
MKDVLLSGHEMFSIDRKPLVSVVAFCLNSNHFHMMIREVEDDGISKFLHRLGMGYTKYFNRRYERSGSLFESTFKAKPLDYEEHLQLLPRYIHLNVLDGTGLDWRTNWPPDWEKAWGILDGYPWSSHSVFAYSRQELPVVDDEVVRKWFPTQDDYRQYLMAYRPYGAEELTFTRL